MSLTEDDVETASDRRLRESFRDAFPSEDAPRELLRQEKSRWSAVPPLGWAALVFVIACGSAIAYFRPPELVREAMEHEHKERTLRGNFMTAEEVTARFGLAPQTPGLPQLTRPCLIAEKVAYHLTTFLKGSGTVTAMSFTDQAIDFRRRAGWWPNTYWRVVTIRQGKELLLLAESRKAIDLAAQKFI